MFGPIKQLLRLRNPKWVSHLLKVRADQPSWHYSNDILTHTSANVQLTDPDLWHASQCKHCDLVMPMILDLATSLSISVIYLTFLLRIFKLDSKSFKEFFFCKPVSMILKFDQSFLSGIAGMYIISFRPTIFVHLYEGYI